MLSHTLGKEHYFESFNSYDVLFRKCKDSKSCRQMYEQSLRYPTSEERAKLSGVITKARDAVSDCSRLSGLPIKLLIFFNKKQGEFMYLHTHGDFIIIPENKVPTLSHITLVHELIHIYQRKYPLETHEILINNMGFKLAGYKSFSEDASKMRSNPDINKILYLDKHDRPVQPIYSFDPNKPSSIIDSRDHPFEMMAYNLADLLVSHTKSTDTMYLKISALL